MAAWLASLTRLASCSWRFGLEALAFCASAARAALRRARKAQEAGAAEDGQRRRQQQHDERAGAEAGLAAELVLHVFERALRSGSLSAMIDGLRFARGHQALQVAEDGAGLRARLLVLLQQRVQALARLRVARARQAQLRAAVEQALGDFAGTSSGPCRAGTRPRGSRLPSVRNSLADLPMRWVSITSWPTAEISAGAAFCCSLSDEHRLGRSRAGRTTGG